ncbi:MAG: hypothetical protein ACRDD1_19365, partial [Planctomycetia bacterium]
MNRHRSRLLRLVARTLILGTAAMELIAPTTAVTAATPPTASKKYRRPPVVKTTPKPLDAVAYGYSAARAGDLNQAVAAYTVALQQRPADSGVYLAR